MTYRLDKKVCKNCGRDIVYLGGVFRRWVCSAIATENCFDGVHSPILDGQLAVSDTEEIY
jgi:hypothetical protein